MVIFLIAAAILVALATCGRSGNSKAAQLGQWYYAHRGLHGDGVPENSMAAFQMAKENGYGIELDVHLLSDGNLAVIHDSELDRTTGVSGRIEDLTLAQMRSLRLEGTQEQIPEFSQVLDLFNGEAPLIVELKSVQDNYAQLCQRVWEYLSEYKGLYCIESFDPRCVYWFRKHSDEVIRGQLTEDYFKTAELKLPWILKLILKNQLLNFLTRPDFIAYRFADRKTWSNYLAHKLWGMQRFCWTLQTPEEFRTAKEEGWIPIFENFMP